MSNYLAALNLNLSAESEGGKHRREVFESTPWAPTPTTNVSYTAANRLLVIADPHTADDIRARLPEKFLCYVAIPSQKSSRAEVATAHYCADLSVSGYLGRFRALIDQHDATNPVADQHNNLANQFNIESGFFDQVLDCSDEPLVTAAIKPPGYHHVGRNKAALEAAIEAIPELVGEFEKPKYFHYNPDICAHGRSGIIGCTRCLDACASDAIFSLAKAVETASIEVIPHLCQGVGTCASSCPTGAIHYVYPKANEQIEFLRVMLVSIRQKNGNRGVTLLIFDNEHGRGTVEDSAARLDDHIIPLVVEEIGSVGLDLIVSAMAYGASRVCLYVPEGIPAQVVDTLQRNLSVVAAVVEQTHCNTHRVEIITDLNLLNEDRNPAPVERAATFAPVGDKRSILRAALSFLGEISPDSPEYARLPAGAPFGQIRLNVDACTLCMGCVSVCPADALQAGGDTPALRFIEANCVQCGICADACPEGAVTLESRFHFDHNVVTTTRTLKEEAPFRCIVCNKAFATQSMITRMTEKLKDHWMFDRPEALHRLKMCEDCRVKDLFEQENTHPK